MKKKTNLHIIKFLLPVIVAVVVTVLGISLSASAQDQPKFKVGDRVEVDPQGYSISNKYKKWHKATVIKIGHSGGGVDSYDVKTDAESNYDSGVFHIITNADMDMIRPLQETGKKDVVKDAAEPENKVEPKKEQPKLAETSCQPSDVISGTSQSDTFKHLIQESYLHKPEGEQDYTAFVTFQTFKIGATHRWRSGVDGDGEGGKAGTTVYPVKVLFTVCKDHPGYAPSGYRGDIEKRQDDKIYSCFKNQFGEWQCNPVDGETIGKVVWTPK